VGRVGHDGRHLCIAENPRNLLVRGMGIDANDRRACEQCAKLGNLPLPACSGEYRDAVAALQAKPSKGAGCPLHFHPERRPGRRHPFTRHTMKCSDAGWLALRTQPEEIGNDGGPILAREHRLTAVGGR
jgi:hypothetical protein